MFSQLAAWKDRLLKGRKTRQERRRCAAREFHPAIEQLEVRSLLTVAEVFATDALAQEKYALTVGSRGTFTFELDSAAESAVTIQFALSGSASHGGANPDPIDYDIASDSTFTSTSITIPSGFTEATLHVQPRRDMLKEGNEGVFLQMGSGSGYAVGSNTAGTITILDDPPKKRSLETVFCPCLCGCPIFQTGFVAQTGAFVVLSNGTGLRRVSSADARPTVSIDEWFEDSALDAQKIEARLTFGGLDPVSVYYDPANLAANQDYRMGLTVDAQTLDTGSYHWEMEIIEHHDGAPSVSRTYYGDQEMTNLTSSVYGQGFVPTYLDRLAIQEDGVSLAMGDGNQFWFTEEQSGDFTVQDGDPEFSSLVYSGYSGTYTRTSKWGDVSVFDSAGLLISRADQFGNEIVYEYLDADGDEEEDDLWKVIDVAGREMEFDYSGGLLSTITDFAGRVTGFTHDDGFLVSIVEPDPDGEGIGEESFVSTFGYDETSGLLTSMTKGASGTTTLEYDHARGLKTRTSPNESTKTYTSEISQGVVDTSEGLGSENDPAPLLVSSSLLGSQTNELDETTSYTTDLFGGQLSEEDAAGNVTLHERDANGLVTKMTSPESGTGFQPIYLYEYDERGNMTQMVTPGDEEFPSAIYTWAYDETWNVPVEEVEFEDGGGNPMPALRWTLYTIDEENGNVLEVRRVMGEPDDELNEETDDAVESFTYTAAPVNQGDPPAGLLETYTNPNGVTTAYAYNGHGLVTEITLAVGTADEAELAFEYDAADNLTAEIDELGRRTEHTYNEIGNRLTTVLEDPDGSGEENPLESPVYTWEYNAMGRVTLAVDPLLRETEYVYGAFGNLMSTTLSGVGFSPRVLEFGYDLAGRLTSQTDALARVTTYTLDALGRTVETILFDPDGEGPLESSTFLQSFSPLGYVDSTTDALGNVTTVVVTDFGRTVTTTLPDPDGELGEQEAPVFVRTMDLLGQLILETDSLGRQTVYEWDMLGRLVRQILPDPDQEGQLESPELQFFYDAASNLIREIDALGNISEHIFDPRGRRVETHLPDPETGEASEDASYTWVYDAASQVIEESDALGRTTLHEFDGLGREIETITSDPDGAGPLESAVFTRGFDAASRLILEVAPNGGETAYEYDLLDNVVAVQLADPDGAGGASRPSFSFVFDAASQLVSETDAMGRTTLHTLDGLGREIETQTDDPDGAGELEPSVWQNSFDANSNLISTLDPLAQETLYEFDNLQRRIKIIDAEEGETSFSFDAASNLLSLTDPVGNTTTWVVDGLNRVIEEENELEDSRYFAYDAMSNLVLKTDRNGREIEYVFDRRNRTVEERWMDGETAVNTISYTFDAVSQLTAASDPSAEYAFTYDALGRVTSETQTITGLTPQIVLASTYNANSMRTQLAASIGGTADFKNDYLYDNLSRMTRVTQQGQSGGNTVAEKRVDLGYNAASQFLIISRYANAAGSQHVASSHLTYDGANRLDKLIHSTSTTAPTSGWGTGALAGYDFTFDNADRITSIDSMVDGLSSFTYDVTSQLTAADHTGQADEAYDFDDNGNRNSSGFTVGTNNQILSDGTYNYEYDGEGNRTARVNISTGERTEYAWDHRNRLVTVTEKDDQGNVVKVVEHSYDFANRWIRRSVDPDGPGSQTAIETFFAGYDGINPTLQFDGDAAADLDHRYLWGPVVDQIFSDEDVSSLTQAGSVIWPLVDQLGTPRDLAQYNSGTSTTTVGNHRVYNAFGSLTSETNSSIDLLFGFTGKPLDESTGLQNNLNRWYDLVLYVWMSEDPIGFAAGDANTRRYLGNSPTNAVDPSGLIDPSEPKDEWGKFGESEKNTWTYRFLMWLGNKTPPVRALELDIEGNSQRLTNFESRNPAGIQGGLTAGQGTQVSEGTQSLLRGLSEADIQIMAASGVFVTGGGAASAGASRVVDPNKLHHIFGQSKHNLAGLLGKFACQSDAFIAIQAATQAVVKTKGITGVFSEVVTVAGEQITVRGTVVNGCVKIGTAFK